MRDVYDALGGSRAVRTAVDVFYRRVVSDPALSRYFAGVDLSRLASHQRAFLTAALGGPDVYAGRGLRAAHRDMGIDDAAFDTITEHLLATLRDLGVAQDIVLEVSDRLENYRDDVVGA